MSLAIQRGLLLFMVENLIRNTIGLKRGLGGGDDYAGLGRIPCRLNWDFGVSISHVEPTQVTAEAPAYCTGPSRLGGSGALSNLNFSIAHMR